MDDTSSTSQSSTDLPQPQAASAAESRASGSALNPPAEPAGCESPRREPAFADRTVRAGSHAPPLPLAELKRAWRIEEVIQAAGTALTRAGEDRLVGHCPFHEDRTPSFTVYLSTQRFQCYGRCHQHGDVLDFVQLVRGCSLTQAIRWLEEMAPTNCPVRAPGPPAPERTPLPSSGDESLAVGPQVSARTSRALTREAPSSEPTLVSSTPAGTWSASAPAAWNEEADRQLMLTLATALYAQALVRHGHGLDYLRQRGIPPRVARQQRLGYSDGRTLAAYCAADPSLLVAAQRSGLLNRAGAERFAGRLVVPEIRAGRTVWMIARSVPPSGHPAESIPLTLRTLPVLDDGDGGIPSAGEHGWARRRMPPRYLGLTTPRHYLLGYGSACTTVTRSQRANGISWDSQDARLSSGILVVEGALDYIVAQSWHLPVLCVALLGTHPSPGQLAELVDLHRRAEGAPVLLALDSDAAGQSATQELARALASLDVPALIVPEVPGAKDLGDLALRPDGRACLLRTLGHVPGASIAPVPRGGPVSSPVAPVSAPAPDRLGQPLGPGASPDGNTRAETWDGAEEAGTP